MVIFSSVPVVLAKELIADTQFKNRVVDVIMDWQASSYSPVWYHGRKLPSAGSEIKIGLTPLDKERSSEYVYLWSINDNTLKDWSNEREFIFKMENIDVTIDVSIGEREDIKTFVGTKVGERINIIKRLSYDLLLAEPELILYSENNNFLTYLDHINSFTGKTIKFSAAPFFFNIKNINQLNFNWSVFNKQVSGEDLSPDKLFLVLNDSLKGKSSSISTYVNQPGRLGQSQSSNNILINVK